MIKTKEEYIKVYQELDNLLKQKEPLLEIEQKINELNRAIKEKTTQIKDYETQQKIAQMQSCNHLFVMYHSSYDGQESTKLCQCVRCGLNNFEKDDSKLEQEMKVIFTFLSLLNARFTPKTFFLTPDEAYYYVQLALNQNKELSDEEINQLIKQKDEEKRNIMQNHPRKKVTRIYPQ